MGAGGFGPARGSAGRPPFSQALTIALATALDAALIRFSTMGFVSASNAVK